MTKRKEIELSDEVFNFQKDQRMKLINFYKTEIQEKNIEFIEKNKIQFDIGVSLMASIAINSCSVMVGGICCLMNEENKKQFVFDCTDKIIEDNLKQYKDKK